MTPGPEVRLPRTTTVLLLAVLVTALLPATVALAQCTPDEQPLEEHIADAEHVWKGTVSGTQDGARTAILTIDEVWKGEPAEDRVRILPDSEEPTPEDRTWVEDETYLVFPRLEEDGEWHDSTCSPTRVWEPELADLRPAGAGTASTGGAEEPEESTPQALILAAIVGGSLLLVTLGMRAVRR